MSATELGKVEKPSADNFKKGRKLYFIPLIYCGKESPDEYRVKYNNYWEQVVKQISDLESKLGKIARIYHELIPSGGADGCVAVKELNEKSSGIVNAYTDKGALLEAFEESDLLTELMDWSQCLVTGLQNQKVISTIYDFYVEINKKRNEYLARRIDESLQTDEAGILLMREGHQIQFPVDIQVFYVAPPDLDDIKRWIRSRETKAQEGQT